MAKEHAIDEVTDGTAQLKAQRDTEEPSTICHRVTINENHGRDDDGYLWLEEYLVQPPSHILNGMIWAAWGIHDYATLGGEPRAQALFLEAVRTLVANLHRYDTGFWSCYELRPGRVPMVASQFYHRLHVTQLDVMDRLTGEEAFGERAVRWRAYQRQPLNRWLAKAWRAAFKILWY